MKKLVLVVFGGISAEHEVSVVTGLQAFEHIDRALYEPLAIYLTKTGDMVALPKLKTRKQFFTTPRKTCSFGKDVHGGYVQLAGLGGKKYYPYAAYFGLHGGLGENGSVQGLFESIDIPYTSPGVEASVIAMNKHLTKEVLRSVGVPVAHDVRVFSRDIEQDAKIAATSVTSRIPLPVIIKPAHLGSSVGISIAKTDVELEKKLIEAARVDSEIVVESFFSGITEYNCAVRRNGNIVETSPIEHPLSSDEILSFADKYERGGKKTGGGMASLSRELPAKIDDRLAEEIRTYAKDAFIACRLKGMARIDFMRLKDGTLYLTEINSIPGSMSFYLWEAAGISYEQLNTELIEQAVKDAEEAREKRLDYASDIIQRFVAG